MTTATSKLRPRGRRLGRVAAATTAAFTMIGGGAFAFANSVGSAGGPADATTAVDTLLSSIAAEDSLGALAAVDPGEAGMIGDSFGELFGELERLEMIDAGGDDGVPGVGIEFSGLTYRTEPVRDGLERVFITGGTAEVTLVPADLPLGGYLVELIERYGEMPVELTSTQPVILPIDLAEEFAGLFLVARDTGTDGWRVSVGYTIAEVLRARQGLPAPTGPGITPIGAESPEAAVEGMLNLIANPDPMEAIARLAPSEFRALHEYLPLFVSKDQLDAGASILPTDGMTITIDNVQLTSEVDGTEAEVGLAAIDLGVTDGNTSVSVSMTDWCLTITGDGPEWDPTELDDTPFANGQEVCIDDPNALLQLIAEETGEALPANIPDLSFLSPSRFSVTTVQVDGQWYVAPIESMVDGFVTMLTGLDRQLLDGWIAFIEELAASSDLDIDELPGLPGTGTSDDPAAPAPATVVTAPAATTVAPVTTATAPPTTVLVATTTTG